MYTTHYSIGQDCYKLARWADSAGRHIADAFGRKPGLTPALVYRGMSGVALATALSLKLHDLGVVHGMVYVRKDEEVSHGSLIERFNVATGKGRRVTDRKAVFVDDLVATGTTLRACIEACYAYDIELSWQGSPVAAIFQDLRDDRGNVIRAANIIRDTIQRIEEAA